VTAQDFGPGSSVLHRFLFKLKNLHCKQEHSTVYVKSSFAVSSISFYWCECNIKEILDLISREEKRKKKKRKQIPLL
jgi:hypothetical protein